MRVFPRRQKSMRRARRGRMSVVFVDRAGAAWMRDASASTIFSCSTLADRKERRRGRCRARVFGDVGHAARTRRGARIHALVRRAAKRVGPVWIMGKNVRFAWDRNCI